MGFNPENHEDSLRRIIEGPKNPEQFELGSGGPCLRYLDDAPLADILDQVLLIDPDLIPEKFRIQ